MPVNRRDLDDEHTRILACAVGDHLPYMVEVQGPGLPPDPTDYR